MVFESVNKRFIIRQTNLKTKIIKNIPEKFAWRYLNIRFTKIRLACVLDDYETTKYFLTLYISKGKCIAYI